MQCRCSKGSKLPIKENSLELFLIGFEMSPCENGRFNIETIWGGRILTPKRPIAAKRYWPGLVSSVRPLLPSRLPFPSSPAARCARLTSPLLTAADMVTSNPRPAGRVVATPMSFSEMTAELLIGLAEILDSL